MEGTMKCAIYHGAKNITIEERPIPQCGEKDDTKQGQGGADQYASLWCGVGAARRHIEPAPVANTECVQMPCQRLCSRWWGVWKIQHDSAEAAANADAQYLPA